MSGSEVRMALRVEVVRCAMTGLGRRTVGSPASEMRGMRREERSEADSAELILLAQKSQRLVDEER